MEKRPGKLFNRHFFLLWQGQFVSQLGNQAFAIAMMFWVKHRTGSASLMGLLLMMSQLPAVLLGPVAGTAADHYSRRKIILFSDLIDGIAVTLLAIFIFRFAGAPEWLIGGLFAVSLLLGIVRAFFSPAIAAAIPDIVPQDKVATANSLNQSSYQIAMFVGQALGGYLYVLVGAPLLFLVDGLSFLFSAFSVTLIKIPQTLPEKINKGISKFNAFKKDTGAGFKFVWNNKGIRHLVTSLAFINFFIMPFIVLLPFYVEDFLHATAAWYGYIMAGFGFGCLIGYGFAGTLKVPAKTRGYLMISSLVAMSLCLPVLSIITGTVPAVVLMIAAGTLNGFFNINVLTVLQLNVPGEIRGRVFGLITTLTAGIAPISMGLSGVIGDLLNHNVPLIFALCGGTAALLSILISFSGHLRNFLADERRLT